MFNPVSLRSSAVAEGAENVAQAPAVSIILVVQDQAIPLLRCLQSVARLPAVPSFDLLIADNGSADATGVLLDGLDGDLTAVRHTSAVSRDCALDEMAARAAGQHLCFLAADVVPVDGWLQAMVDEFDVHPEAGAVMARACTSDGRLLPEDAWSGILVRREAFVDVGGFAGAARPMRSLGATFLAAIKERGWAVRTSQSALMLRTPATSTHPQLPLAAAEDPRTALAANLRLLNDVLAHEPIAGRYWLQAGLLLGWARERQILGSDPDDVDFFYSAWDTDRLLASVDALESAGFKLVRRFPGATGDATQISFERDGAVFEFFRADLVDDRIRYWSYGYGPNGPIVNRAEICAQPLEEFWFLDRTWLKPRDHDAELTEMYADWRTPRPDWSYMDNPSIVERSAWDDSTYDLTKR